MRSSFWRRARRRASSPLSMGRRGIPRGLGRVQGVGGRGAAGLVRPSRRHAEIAAPDAAPDLLRTGLRVRRRCRDGSALASVGGELCQKRSSLAYRQSTRRSAIVQRRPSEPTASNRFGEEGICQHRTTPLSWRDQFGNDAVTMRHEHRFSRCGEAHIFAQFVPESFDAYRAHSKIVATRSYFVSRRPETRGRLPRRRPDGRTGGDVRLIGSSPAPATDIP
jgi:hypothetical protein